MTTYPTCSTCMHLGQDTPVPPHGKASAPHSATCMNPQLMQFWASDDTAYGGYSYIQDLTVPSLSFGCVLHSDLTEAGA